MHVIFQVMANRHGEILKIKDSNKSSLFFGDNKIQLKDPASMSTVMEEPVSINKENQSIKFNRRKNNDFIFDKQLRIKSFLRRRGIPFKRCSELDTQCGTKSFHLQTSKDLDETVYSGSPDLVELFLSSGGIKISDLNRILLENKSNSRGKSDSQDEEDNSYCDSDEDFFDTVKSKHKKEKEIRDESAKRMAQVEYLTSSVERNKRFKAVKDGILSKISELENVSGVMTLTIIINTDKDFFIYSGDPSYVTSLFTTGVRRVDIPVSFNVRVFDNDEVRLNIGT